MKVTVDRSVCASLGQCEYTDPDHFTINDEGDLDLVEEPPDAARETVLRAVDACPVRALTARD